MTGRRCGLATALALLAVAGALVGCQRAGSDTTATDERVIVLGFDGMDWELVQKLMVEGRMPNFQRLAREGMAQPLGTSMPPLSPVAWSNFITGMDSGGHGIFDFVHRDPQTLLPYLSTSRSVGSDAGFDIGKWHVPLGGAHVELLRHGTAFWEPLRERGIPTTVLRIPANYPPSGTADRELSGMGTPDLLGTYGTFSFYNSDPFFEQRSVSGGALYPLDYWDDVATGELHGPPNTFLKEPEDLTLEFQLSVDPQEPAALLRVGDEERLLQVGEWSDWVPFEFSIIPTQSLPGQARFYLRSVRPEVELYVTPINIDPHAPAQPVSTPEDYAAELAEASGRFYTQGMPEDTKALEAEVLTRDEFLAQTAIIQEELERQFDHVLGQFRSGLLFYYFGYTDQVAHMLWGSMDPEHPLYDPEVDPKYADVIPQLYEDADRLVGKTLREVGDDTTVVVMSDHGFSSWRRTFNLNTWLEREGYLALSEPPAPGSNARLDAHVDWSRTRAYGMGLNGLYVNLAGREREGVVPESERAALLREIAAKLEEVVDPETDKQVIRRVFISDQAFDDRGYLEIGPDAVIGYAKTYNGSSKSATGELTPEVLSDNTRLWTGDHGMDPVTVPGILFANRELSRKVTSLEDLAAAVVAEFGIDEFPRKGNENE